MIFRPDTSCQVFLCIGYNNSMLEKWIELLRRMILACAFTGEKPAVFGAFHCGMTLCMIALAAFGAYMVHGRSDDEKIRLLHWCGIVMLISEIWKQLFCYFVVNGETFSWWYFPFQLCSMPMYLTLVLPYTKHKGTILHFLGGYGFLAGLLALLFPEDMLRVWPVFTMHGFLWHGIMLFMAMTAWTMRMAKEASDASAVRLFLLLCAIAEVINCTGAYTHPSVLPDMFYISPFTVSYQPVFRDICRMLGRVPQIVIYIVVLSFAAWVVWKCVERSGNVDKRRSAE